jgi:hypothetical protein
MLSNKVLSRALCLNCFLVTARSPTFAIGDSPRHCRVAKTGPKLPYRVSGLGPGLAATGPQGRGRGPSASSAIRLALETCF